MREYIESKGPKTLAPPVMSAELFARVNEHCGCICCQMNQTAAERVLLAEMNELQNEAPSNPSPEHRGENESEG